MESKAGAIPILAQGALLRQRAITATDHGAAVVFLGKAPTCEDERTARAKQRSGQVLKIVPPAPYLGRPEFRSGSDEKSEPVWDEGSRK
jgi:hypothetical protein